MQAQEIAAKLEQLSSKRLEISNSLKSNIGDKGDEGALIYKLAALIAGKMPIAGMQHHSASLR